MVEQLRMAFVGGGTMAEAILAGVLENGLTSSGSISVGEPIAARREYLKSQYDIEATEDNLTAIYKAEVVVLAVKPQQLAHVMTELRGTIGTSQAVLSIVAGTDLESISEGLDHPTVIRAMPNTPAQIGLGVTVWTAASSVSDEQRHMAMEVIRTLGLEIYVSDEKYMNMATALSASGPAYVFLFIEALVDAGVYLGLPRDMAQVLAMQTTIGSATLAQQSGKHTAVLRDMVTSPGGTTAEALLALEEGGFRGILINAVVAAYEKAITLGERD